MPDEPIDDILEHGVTTTPDTTAIEMDDGSSLTFEELDQRVGAIAGGIATLDIDPGEAIAIACSNRLMAVMSSLAAIRAGTIATPIDIDAPEAVVADQIARGDIDVLITDIARFDALSVDTVDPDLLRDGPYLERRPLRPTQQITQLFTSGSTGEPTPVIHSAANHVAASKGAIERLQLEVSDRWYDPLAMHHMGGFAPIVRSLPEGITVVISTERGPEDLLHRLDRTNATLASIVPTMLQRMLTTDVSCPETLRCLLVGGAPLREVLFRRAHEANLPVWSSYGMTETVGQVATATPTERVEYPGTVGHPLIDTEIRILDPDGHPLPSGEIGTIEVTGPTVSASVATAVDRSRHRLQTNDIGHLDGDGRLWVHGRQDDAIHTGGEVVHPNQIEETLLDHPHIDDIAVIGRHDPEWGERIEAAIVTDTALDCDDISAWASDRLPAHAIPKSIVLITEIPRTASGTVDRPALRDHLDESGD